MRKIHSYIDRCLIDEYAHEGELDIDALPKNERNTFLELLMEDDTAVRDIVHYHMQRMIDDRLNVRGDCGRILQYLPNGDVQIVRLPS